MYIDSVIGDRNFCSKFGFSSHFTVIWPFCWKTLGNTVQISYTHFRMPLFLRNFKKVEFCSMQMMWRRRKFTEAMIKKSNKRMWKERGWRAIKRNYKELLLCSSVLWSLADTQTGYLIFSSLLTDDDWMFFSLSSEVVYFIKICLAQTDMNINSPNG